MAQFDFVSHIGMRLARAAHLFHCRQKQFGKAGIEMLAEMLCDYDARAIGFGSLAQNDATGTIISLTKPRLKAGAVVRTPYRSPGSASLRHFASNSNDAYLLSKRAILAAVKREAKAFGERKARLVAVSPGLIDTAMTQGPENPMTSAMLANAAIPRLGRPEEVAAACIFLCSPAASFITGCDLKVDGGELAGMGI